MNALKHGLTGKLSGLHKHSNSPLGWYGTAQDILLAAVKAHLADCSRIALQAHSFPYLWINMRLTWIWNLYLGKSAFLASCLFSKRNDSVNFLSGLNLLIKVENGLGQRGVFFWPSNWECCSHLCASLQDAFSDALLDMDALGFESVGSSRGSVGWWLGPCDLKSQFEFCLHYLFTKWP